MHCWARNTDADDQNEHAYGRERPSQMADDTAADTTIEQAQRDFGDLESADQTTVQNLVDGNTTTGGDLRAIGEQLVNGANGIRKFQSIELWWNHLTCEEARLAVGDDDDGDLDAAFDHDFDTTTATVAETSLYCTDVDGTVTRNDFRDLNEESQSQAVAVALRLNGFGAYSSDDSILTFAFSEDSIIGEGWWENLAPHQRVAALYGDGVTGTGTVTAVDTNGDNTNDAVAADRVLLWPDSNIVRSRGV